MSEARVSAGAADFAGSGDAFGSRREDSPAELARAVAEAREAQKEWNEIPIKTRARSLANIRAFLSENADEIVKIISADTGKTHVEALATELIPAQIALSYYLRKAPGFLKTKFLPPSSFLLANKWSKLVRAPYGVIAVISPWNYPFAIPFSEILTGILAGNAVIFKASSESRGVAGCIEACLQACELPKGLFKSIHMPGKTAGDALLACGVDKLFFTGSVAVGKRLMAKAAETLTPVSLELGGNDAMVVCEDADLDRATSGAVWAGMQNCGQSCGGIERVYVCESVYDEFLWLLKAKVEALRVGPGHDRDVDMGAMTTRRQMETVRQHIEDALSKGAVIAARSAVPEGPGGPDGNFMAAVVLTEVYHGMLVMREETFGPVLGVMKVKDVDEAVALANDSIYGLTGSVWSRRTRKAEKIGRRMRAGVVTINDHLMSHGMPETPWGGFKSSGIGRGHGEAGFHEMTQPQVVVHDLLWFARRNLWWQPYGMDIYQGLKGAMSLFYGSGLTARIRGIRPLLKILPRLFR
jgi:succinate-semialdehyde dehydrogenase/glutarate-semialdehyde dehydrogenase